LKVNAGRANAPADGRDAYTRGCGGDSPELSAQPRFRVASGRRRRWAEVADEGQHRGAGLPLDGDGRGCAWPV